MTCRGLNILLITIAIVLTSSGTFAAPQKCGGADLANGPFSYTALGVTQATFNGPGGAPLATGTQAQGSKSPERDVRERAPPHAPPFQAGSPSATIRHPQS